MIMSVTQLISKQIPGRACLGGEESHSLADASKARDDPHPSPLMQHHQEPLMNLSELNISDLITEYLHGPQLLCEAVAGMTKDEAVARPISGKWSTLEVVAHLADFEPVYADRMKRTLAENEPTLFGGDPDKFAARLAYHDRNLESELKLIDIVRQQMATILRTVPAADFERVGRHSEAGPLTLRTFLERITGHIPHHLPFIAEKRRALTETLSR